MRGDAGFDVFVGRSIDFAGTELPYQPFADALRRLGEPVRVEERTGDSQLRVFQDALALLTERAARAPVLLVLEDLHWADTSTLDLVVFLAHNVDERPVLLVGTYRADEPSSAERMRRVADGVRRCGALHLELGPLPDDELEALLAARGASPLPRVVTDAIVARAEGNPFFAQELLAAGGGPGDVPRSLGDVLLHRVERLDASTRSSCAWRPPPAATSRTRCCGRPPACRRRASAPRCAERSRRASSSWSRRGPASASATRCSPRRSTRRSSPGEREALHGRLADALARGGAAAPGELAPHWAAAGRTAEALSPRSTRRAQAEAVFGLAEALAHLERALDLWDTVPDAAELVGLDLPAVCARAAELASRTGAAPRAVELARRAIDVVGAGDPSRAARLHQSLARYLHESGRPTPASPRRSARSSSCRREPDSPTARGARRARPALSCSPGASTSAGRLGAGADARPRGSARKTPSSERSLRRHRPRLSRPPRRGARAAAARHGGRPRRPATRTRLIRTDVFTPTR